VNKLGKSGCLPPFHKNWSPFSKAKKSGSSSNALFQKKRAKTLCIALACLALFQRMGCKNALHCLALRFFKEWGANALLFQRMGCRNVLPFLAQKSKRCVLCTFLKSNDFEKKKDGEYASISLFFFYNTPPVVGLFFFSKGPFVHAFLMFP
jgi:hypothetical protein